MAGERSDGAGRESGLSCTARVVDLLIVWKDGLVPLSEDEERILSEIAQQFYDDDPSFAREVAETTLYKHSFRNIKWAGLLFVVGLVLLVATLPTSFLLAFAVGFVPMLASALIIERNARKMGKAGWDQATSTLGTNGFRDYLGSTQQRVRDRLKRDEE